MLRVKESLDSIVWKIHFPSFSGLIDSILKWRKQVETKVDLTLFSCLAGVSYIKNFLNFANDCRDFKNFFSWDRDCDEIMNILNWRKILEIWVWLEPFNLHSNCWEYLWIDPFTWWIWWIIETDWLSFLRWCEDDFATIVSFWVIDDGIILSWDYLKEMVEEIKRVSDWYALLVGFDVLKYFWEDWLVIKYDNLWWLYKFSKKEK